MGSWMQMNGKSKKLLMKKKSIEYAFLHKFIM